MFEDGSGGEKAVVVWGAIAAGVESAAGKAKARAADASHLVASVRLLDPGAAVGALAHAHGGEGGVERVLEGSRFGIAAAEVWVRFAEAPGADRDVADVALKLQVGTCICAL